MQNGTIKAERARVLQELTAKVGVAEETAAALDKQVAELEAKLKA